MLAKDITDCDECPLHNNDCSGGWTSGAGGVPIEPPCCNWNDNDEIEESMYSYVDDNDFDYEWYEKNDKEKEEQKREEYHRDEQERLRKLVYNIDRNGCLDTRYYGSICYSWFCKNCNRWVYPSSEHSHDGITETNCPRCGRDMVSCGNLED